MKKASNEVPSKVVPAWSGMTLDQWQQSPAHTDWAQRAIGEKKFRDMLAVLQNASVSVDINALDPTKAAYALGYTQGIQWAVHIISRLPNFEGKAKPYSDPDYLAESTE